ncbi:MAG: hypothetical protein J6T10_21560 [Methanobrevibacter sp.]|nr:hypothetical protein [Methanobrevibacter sp.]
MSWYVEERDFEEDLLNHHYEILIKQGIEKVINLVNNKNKEIERLNNIINEFERLLQQDLENEKDTYWTNITKEDYIQFMLNKLQELKGSDKE